MQLPLLSSKIMCVLFLLWSTACGVFGYALNVYVATDENDILGTTLREENNTYRFISPLLACNVGASSPTHSLDALKKDLEDLVERNISEQNIENASFYVRALADGSWTGVEEDTQYTPASLMKVPVLIAYFKQSEHDNNLLSSTVTITEDPAPNTVQDIAPETSVIVGETYTIDELLSLMIVYSDNRALNVLMDYLDFSVLEESFTDLGIAIPQDSTPYKISPRLYSRFFRILYNATYLSQENSEKALRLLNKATFTEGIRAGVPESIDVAHKFGESTTFLATEESGHELHDCGIVYTESPYVLCVMTKGKSVDALSVFLKEISGHVYEYGASKE